MLRATTTGMSLFSKLRLAMMGMAKPRAPCRSLMDLAMCPGFACDCVHELRGAERGSIFSCPANPCPTSVLQVLLVLLLRAAASICPAWHPHGLWGPINPAQSADRHVISRVSYCARGCLQKQTAVLFLVGLGTRGVRPSLVLAGPLSLARYTELPKPVGPLAIALRTLRRTGAGTSYLDYNDCFGFDDRSHTVSKEPSQIQAYLIDGQPTP